VAGNLKYDIPVLIVPQEKKEKLRAKYRIPVGVPVVTFGSTHQGEEEAVLAVCLTLSGEGREFFLVLAPRHPERAGEVEELLQRCGLSFSRRSTLTERSRMFNSGESLLVDTVGELMDLYSISDLVFVGGSLVPVGGHNVLEPASLGVPVLFGPHMNNFREIASRVLGCGGGVLVEDSSMLATVIRDLLDSPAARQEMGEKGARLLREHSGSTGRHMAIISSVQAEGRGDATGLCRPREHGDI
jgi:3-deoxy-D-manno-octulosonic-acid transferase